MTIYIAQFSAKHRVIQIEQQSVFTWKQESGDIDMELLKNKILRESTIHFFSLVAGDNYPILEKDLKVQIVKTQPFNG